MKSILAAAALALIVPIGAVADCIVPAPPVAVPHQRLLPLQGGQNFRDLGGYPTGDGHTVRWGLLYRSGSMHFLTPADYAYLSRLGIATVCDLRSTAERSAEPSLWPTGTAPRILADDYSLPALRTSLPGSGPSAARPNLADMYPVLLKQFNSQYRRMFAELLAGHAPLAFHCTAGKDRTGIAAALLLTALGVPRPTVIDDYLLTNRTLDPARITYHGIGQLSPALLKAYSVADPAFIGRVFQVMDAHTGGTTGYLRDELGLTPDRIARLRQMYTE